MAGDDDDKPLTLTAYDQLLLSVRSMSSREIKQELSTRGVSFDDCFEKGQLVDRLAEARMQLAAEVIGEKDVIPDSDSPDSDGPADKAQGDEAAESGGRDRGDTAPRGASPRDSRVFNEELMARMKPEVMETLLQDQELLSALRNPSVIRMAQSVMQDPSCAGHFAGDPDVKAAVDKVQAFMHKMGLG
eukprot:CAMPEP_0113664268 /NCGR_PEP_ID=MMETSP0038_2-20120614/1633_1 /TAXON_ID=2898 /ORGANISM="Cryptomonas paramecium" /LENGTH=187 /DNA_ID=CAMNT_0000579447 /DNA_START=177 /DNA_END=736 /DNA_ORIENTATION=- /assembly_acc=CAM_ASM_000170